MLIGKDSFITFGYKKKKKPNAPLSTLISDTILDVKSLCRT